jgi:hypothetical protein
VPVQHPALVSDTVTLLYFGADTNAMGHPGRVALFASGAIHVSHFTA